jgi:hypothetical protein
MILRCPCGGTEGFNARFDGPQHYVRLQMGSFDMVREQ